MTRLNLILFFGLIFSALGLVNSQHKARNLYIELEQLKSTAKQYDQEYGQLQLEQSTWAMHSRIEEIASRQLQMQVPDAKRVQTVTLGAAYPKEKSVDHLDAKTQATVSATKNQLAVEPNGVKP